MLESIVSDLGYHAGGSTPGVRGVPVRSTPYHLVHRATLPLLVVPLKA
jgi:hypothetical protein